MFVQLTTSRASVRGFWDEGSVVDLSAKEARRLIEQGSAIPYRNTPVEKATRRRGPQKTEPAA